MPRSEIVVIPAQIASLEGARNKRLLFKPAVWSGGRAAISVGEISSRTISQARGIGDMMVKHNFSGLCRGGQLDGQSLEHHQNVYRIFEPPSYELLGEYWHQDGKWTWRPSSNRTNDVK